MKRNVYAVFVTDDWRSKDSYQLVSITSKSKLPIIIKKLMRAGVVGGYDSEKLLHPSGEQLLEETSTQQIERLTVKEVEFSTVELSGIY